MSYSVSQCASENSKLTGAQPRLDLQGDMALYLTGGKISIEEHQCTGKLM